MIIFNLLSCGVLSQCIEKTLKEHGHWDGKKWQRKRNTENERERGCVTICKDKVMWNKQCQYKKNWQKVHILCSYSSSSTNQHIQLKCKLCPLKKSNKNKNYEQKLKDWF